MYNFLTNEAHSLLPVWIELWLKSSALWQIFGFVMTLVLWPQTTRICRILQHWMLPQQLIWTESLMGGAMDHKCFSNMSGHVLDSILVLLISFLSQNKSHYVIKGVGRIYNSKNIFICIWSCYGVCNPRVYSNVGQTHEQQQPKLPLSSMNLVFKDKTHFF